jgi:hypothetical protein
MAEGGTMLIKSHGTVAGFFFLKYLEKHTEKTLHCVSVHAGGCIKQRQRVKSPVYQAVAVHNKKRFLHAGSLPWQPYRLVSLVYHKMQ